VAVAHRAVDGLDQVRRRLESERNRIAASIFFASATMFRMAYVKPRIRADTRTGALTGMPDLSAFCAGTRRCDR
jgi:hypothetical protein